MSQPYVGEIRMFGGNFAPAGWMFCEGQLLPISEFETLFNLIGTTYGGDGQSTFQLPDLRGRLPVHQGNGFTLAETGGVETVTLTTSQIPGHSHPYLASTSPGQTKNPTAMSLPPSSPEASTCSSRLRPPWVRTASRLLAEASRTTTSSRTCASISSSRCSAYSPPRPRKDAR
jgi:microcystin-dependent protein